MKDGPGGTALALLIATEKKKKSLINVVTQMQFYFVFENFIARGVYFALVWFVQNNVTLAQTLGGLSCK